MSNKKKISRLFTKLTHYFSITETIRINPILVYFLWLFFFCKRFVEMSQVSFDSLKTQHK